MKVSDMATIILDTHGIVYCHDSGYDLSKSGERFNVELEKYARQGGRYSDVIEEHENGDVDLAHEIEYDSIKKGLTEKSCLQLYFLPEAIDAARKLFDEKNRIIAVCAAKVETINIVLTEFLKIVKMKYPVDKIDMYESSKFGSKKESGTWKAVFKNYDRIDMIFEDKPENLEAANMAAETLGFKAFCSTTLSDLK